MEILRIAENITTAGIGVTIEVPGSQSQSEHILSITDLGDLSVSTLAVQTSGGSDLTFYLNKNYDNSYLVDLSRNGLSIFSETYDIVRPYVNPNTLGTTASEIAEYKKWEFIARAIIDNYSNPVEFYNRKKTLQTKGTGADYVPVWLNANSVLKVYENDILIYDADDVSIRIANFDADESGTLITTLSDNKYAIEDIVTLSGFTDSTYNVSYRILEILSPTQFRINALSPITLNNSETVKKFWETEFNITLDRSAIYRLESEEANRIYSSTIKLPASHGDIASGVYNYGSFPERYNYIFIVDEGFVRLPTDIVYAAEMLIDDLKCGRLDYYQRYVTSYNTDQFRIQFDKSILSGTGNVIVDKVLDKYAKSITKVGVL
jgi:hypothetical protein